MTALGSNQAKPAAHRVRGMREKVEPERISRDETMTVTKRGCRIIQYHAHSNFAHTRSRGARANPFIAPRSSSHHQRNPNHGEGRSDVL